MTWHIKANSPRDLTVYARVYKLALQRSKATSLQLYEAIVLFAYCQTARYPTAKVTNVLA